MFLPGNPRDGDAWWAAVYGVAQSDTTEVTKQQQQGFCWALLVAQLEKNPPAVQETPVQFLDQENRLEKG